MELVESKAEVSQIVKEPISNGGMVIDLMAALQASMAAIKEKDAKPKKSKKA